MLTLPTTRFLAYTLGLLLPLTFPLFARADFATDVQEPVRLLQAKEYAKASVALDKIAPQYQDQFLLHFMRGMAKMGQLGDENSVPTNVALLQNARASLLKAGKLATGAEQKKQALDLLNVAEQGLKELGAPLEAPQPPAEKTKDEEIAELRRRLAELEGKDANAPAPAPDAALVVGPPDIPLTLPKLAPLKPTPHTAKGRVVNRSGKPLPGVEVKVSGTTLAGEHASFYPKTDAQGIFSTPLPDGLYTTRAEVKTNYNDQTFILPLHPLDSDHDLPQDSRKGVVEDYVWRLSGKKDNGVEDEEKPYLYYGGQIKGGITDMGSYGVINDKQGTRELAEFPDGFRIDITFTPEGTLPDGLPGRAFSFTKSFKPQKTGGFGPYEHPEFNLVDVPVGRYTVRARLTKPDGSVRDMLLTTRIYRPLQTPATSQVMDFEPDTSSVRPVNIQLYAFPVAPAN